MSDRDTEITLIRKAMEGEASAFGTLYDKYQPRIFRFIFLKVSHREEAEDLTHQVFLSAWQNVERFVDEGLPFSSWLYRIARNKVIDFYRTHRRATTLESVPEEILVADENIEGLAEKKLKIENVYRALQELTDEQRDVILLRFVDELSYEEIAASLKRNQTTIRVIQYRAIKKIKKVLKQKYESNH